MCVQKLSQQRRGYVLCTRRFTDKTYQAVAFCAFSLLVLCIPKFVLARATVLGLPHTRVCRSTFTRGHMFVRRYEAKVEAFRKLDTLDVRGFIEPYFVCSCPPLTSAAFPYGRSSSFKRLIFVALWSPYLANALHAGNSS